MHVKLVNLHFICLVVLLELFFEIPYAVADRGKNHFKKRSSISEAAEFIEKTDTEYGRLLHESMLAFFGKATNATAYNADLLEKINKELSDFFLKTMREAKKIDWKSFKDENGTIYRWFKLYTNTRTSADGIRLSKEKEEKTMEEIYREAKVCPYKSEGEKNCSLSLNPDVVYIMANSDNPDELLSMWSQTRNATGRKMRRAFLKTVHELDRYAKWNGFSDFGDVYKANYEEKNFTMTMDKIMGKIFPLYRQLHAYVRRKFIGYFKDVKILDNGPIPAHLLGNLFAQEWDSRIHILNPFPGKKIPNVTDHMTKKGMKAIDLFIMAENFFESIGFKRMTPYFWVYSMIEKPDDREAECHASAHDFMNNKDFRIKMCTEIDANSLKIVHHEMGHIQYYMHMTHLLNVFRDSANSGFHEAVGEVITLSATTPGYLKTVLFQDEEYAEDEETDIIHLLTVALKYIPTIPYAYIMDTYRYNVFNGSTKEEHLNRDWWKLRLKYQGVCPPVKRTEEDFDPGAKYHVAYNVEYMRYFYANVLAFQIHKSLCIAAGHKGPLHRCNIYNSTEAGNQLKKVLELGKSKTPDVVMEVLTNNRTCRLRAEPFLEYFQPLADWLEKQNENKMIGWESADDPMICPTDKDKTKTEKECL